MRISQPPHRQPGQGRPIYGSRGARRDCRLSAQLGHFWRRIDRRARCIPSSLDNRQNITLCYARDRRNDMKSTLVRSDEQLKQMARHFLWTCKRKAYLAAKRDGELEEWIAQGERRQETSAEPHGVRSGGRLEQGGPLGNTGVGDRLALPLAAATRVRSGEGRAFSFAHHVRYAPKPPNRSHFGHGLCGTPWHQAECLYLALARAVRTDVSRMYLAASGGP